MDNDFDIAIVGLACRFPGAKNADEFWKNLANGVESITRLTDEEILQSGVLESHLAARNYVKAAPVLEEPGAFDAAFFGYTPGEARMMDPQQRILLELAHESLEDAGIVPSKSEARVGVFTGSAMNTYFMHAGLGGKFSEDYIPTLIANDKDFLSTRISYKLDLKGPSLTVQTACSTSLVAVHLARQSLLSEECDIALAGAISVRVPHRAGYFSDAGGVTSPDGHVRAFDADANGTVFGSGGGVIVMKRLRNALADGDTIQAIIKGSAINNDGAEKAGYTAPSVNSQADAIVEALANADVDADSISYIETHGSGTPVGDPIEMRALTKAFRTSTQRAGFCAIGSVKTNVGHLDAAAGMAGLIKTVLALQHRQIPASLNYSRPNPEIDFAATPFFVNTRLAEWKSDGPRRAGIMATGMGGTNAHVVIEEAPATETTPESQRPNLFVLSARTGAALAESTEKLGAFLAANPSAKLDNAAFTLQTGRRAMRHRRFVVARDHTAALAALAAKPARQTSAEADGAARPLVLLLPGVGDHYVGMGRELYSAFPVFRTEVDCCAEILRAHLGHDIRGILWPKNRDWKKSSAGLGIDLKKMLAGNTQPADDADTQRLNEITNLQPALFTIEYALAKLWIDLIGEPQAIVGHSMGEYAAACLSGVFSLEDALRLVVRRTQLVASLPPAKMLAVTLPEAELLPLLPGELSVALINGPALCIVAGPPDAVEKFAATLAARGVMHRPVLNTHAFHSRMLTPITRAFADEVRNMRRSAPRIAFTSNVTGRWITAAEASDPEYWARHADHTARFDDALRTLWQMENPILLEAGPGRTLSVLAQQHPAKPQSAAPTAITSLRHHYETQADEEVLLIAAGRLWLSGITPDWNKLHANSPRRKIPLPTYPFEKQIHWLETKPAAAAIIADDGVIRKNADLTQWLSTLSWKRTVAMPVSAESLASSLGEKDAWLFFLDDCGIGAVLAQRFRAAGQTVATVRLGHAFAEAGGGDFTIRPAASEDYLRVIESIATAGISPGGIVHAWGITAQDSTAPIADALRTAQESGFHSLLCLVQALSRHGANGRLRLFVLSNHVQDVLGTEALCPEKSLLLGPCLVIPQEFPNVITKHVDLELPAGARFDERAADLLTAEICGTDSEVFVAHRNGHRWVQCFEQITLREDNVQRPSFREGGAYLITGGLGNVGGEIARHLARNFRAKLALTGRAQMPPREAWAQWLREHAGDDPTARRIRTIGEIEGLGGTVHFISADAGDRDAMRRAVEETERVFGAIHGVIHCAGITGNEGYREIRDVDRVSCEAHFATKVRGLLVLDEALAGRTPDFCLAMSSLSAILGGIGQAAYSAANIFMDAFARMRARGGGMRWLSVNWDVWRTQENVWGQAGLGKTLEELGMTGDEAMRAMQLALPFSHTGQVVVSTGSLDARLRQWVKLESLRSGQTRSVASRETNPDGSQTSPESEIEQLVSEVWQTVLGMDAIGTDENFVELGGHSLLAMQIVARLRTAYRVDITLREFFDAPTIARISAIIGDKLMADIENLTDEQVRELIAKEAAANG